METKNKKKINRNDCLKFGLLFVLVVLAVFSVVALSIGASPKQIYSALGLDYSRCHGTDGCFAFCNVGNGDASIVYTEQAIGVVDFGFTDYAYSFHDKVNALTDQPLDFAVISHPHNDHAGGFEVMAKTVGIKRLYMREYTNEQLKDYTYYQNILAIAETYHIQVIHPQSGDVVQVGDITLSFCVPEVITADENERCLIANVSIGGQSCLYVGDIGASTEEVLLNSGFDVTADLLKVGHHGSKKGSSLHFLQEVNPSFAVISVGYNSYGHPSTEVVERFMQQKIPFYRTDSYHQIVFSVNKTELEVQFI